MTDLRTAAQQALEALDAYSWEQVDAARTALKAALAEPVQEPPEFPPHDDKIHAGAVYWYVGTDGKYYSSNEVKLFMEAKNKSLHYEPPKWVLDNFDLIPLYTAPPRRDTLTEEEIERITDEHWPDFVAFTRAIERAHGIDGAPEERNFCSRCGKRTQDIHTCTPPGDNDVHS